MLVLTSMMLTGFVQTAAAAIGVDGHQIAVDHEANLLIHGHDDVHEVLNHHEAPQVVISRGKVVAETATESKLFI